MPIRFLIAALIAVPLAGVAEGADTVQPVPGAIRDYPVKPVPFTAVQMTDKFWAPKIEINRTVTIPAAFEQCEKTGRVDNFDRAAAVLRGQKPSNLSPPGYPFDDTDIYKVLEGASYCLSVKPDPKLDAYLDSLIAKIGAAQEPDGYLYTTRTINPAEPHKWAGKQRWELEEDLSHELYNLGHLFEAAVAHYQATGKRSLLDIAIKTASLLVDTFGPGKREIWPGHEITEMGLAKLSRVTGDQRYLELAKFMIDVRGPGDRKVKASPYCQSHRKVVDQTEAVGHAVRATYLYAGVADVAAMTGDPGYIRAIDAIWHNCVDKKLYITGGIGARHSGEAFGEDYELPNMSAYNETCAAIGNVYWNHRLFLLHADAKYIDVLERTLYNGLLSGVSLDGKSFFYPNPLESRGQHARSPWFGCACCPGNITRFIASVSGYMYGMEDDAIYVNLFGGSTAKVTIAGMDVELRQETNYPWDGAVKLAVAPQAPATFALNLRIPGWARNEAVPGDLYRFTDTSNEQPSIKLNGQPMQISLTDGYVSIRREWKTGDTVELNLPMPPRRMVANQNVKSNVGRVALQRGPLVYCLEWPDNRDVRVRSLMVPDSAKLSTVLLRKVLGGVMGITGDAQMIARDDSGQITRTPTTFTAIPYYGWANRGRGEMIVWIPTSEAAAVLKTPTIASTSLVTTSGGATADAINDQEEPLSSSDESGMVFHWWPNKGTTEWVQYTFEKPATVAFAEVYWYDDTGRGECRVPRSWRIVYRDGEAWTPVSTKGTYRTEKNGFNRIAFTPVTTSAVRLEVVLQPEWSAGIHEWCVGR
jgi:DUF1680 family protein